MGSPAHREGLPDVHVAEETYNLDKEEEQEDARLQAQEGPWGLAG